MKKREKSESGDRHEKSDRLIFTLTPEMARQVDLYSSYTHIRRSELGRMAMELFLDKNSETLEKAIKAQGKSKD